MNNWVSCLTFITCVMQLEKQSEVLYYVALGKIYAAKSFFQCFVFFAAIIISTLVTDWQFVKVVCDK